MGDQLGVPHRAGAHSSWFPASFCPTCRDHRIPKPQPCPQEHPRWDRGWCARDLNKPQPQEHQQQDTEKQKGLGCRLSCVRQGGVLILTSIPVPCLTHWGGTVNSHHILSAEVVTETQPHVKGSIQRLHLLMEECKRICGHILKRTSLTTEWLML